LKENLKPLSKLQITVMTFLIFIVVIILARYVTNQDFRNLVDTKILNKQVTENDLNYIEINSEDSPTVFAYDSFIGVFSKSTLSIYNGKGNVENDLSLNITTPIYNTAGKYVILAEKNGSKFFVINSTSMLWEGSIDGKINKININENGYVTIIISNSTYNSIVIVYNSDGTELFKSYFPSTYAMTATISKNNDYVAIGEIDYSGTVIKSNIRIMNLSDAQIVYQFNAPDNEILNNIKYTDKNMAICSFSNSIYKISTSEATKICDITEETSFANIDMTNILALIERQSSGLFSYEYHLTFQSLISNTENLYVLSNGLPKQTIACGKIIALNYGSSVDVINQNGALKKSYTSTQQIKSLVVGEHIVGILYKDKIEIINL
jgi:hypothetical protein